MQQKNSEYLYEFEDTDTEEDQAAQDTSGGGDRNYHANSDSGSDSDTSAKEPAASVAATAPSSPPPAPPSSLDAAVVPTTPLPVPSSTAAAEASPTDSKTPSVTQRCNHCDAHNSLQTCPRGFCSWCCKHSDEGPCAAHNRSKRKREPPAEVPVPVPVSVEAAPPPAPVAPPAKAAKSSSVVSASKPPPPPGKRGRGRPRKNPLPVTPTLTPTPSTPTPTVAASPDTASMTITGADTSASSTTPTAESATTAVSPRATPVPEASPQVPAEEQPAVVSQGKSKKKRVPDKVTEQAKAAKRLQMQEKRFVRLFRSLRRMNHLETKRRDLLEAGSNPNEGTVNGTLYRKIKRSVVDNIGVASSSGAGANDEEITDDEQETNQKANEEEGEDEGEGERCWVDRYGWPLEEEIYIGTDIMAEWETWRDEHQRLEDQMEEARRAAATPIPSTSTSSSSSSTAESASALFSPQPHYNSNGHRRGGSVRGSENGFGGWNDDRCGGTLVSFDAISDDSDNEEGSNNRRARFGARSLSFDAAGARGAGSGDEGSAYTRSESDRPRFMSRHAAKMRKRFPMLAEWRASNMTYEDKRQLMRDITLLDADHVPELLKIIFRQMPDSFATRQMLAQTIDMDVSFLSPATLSRVEDYVYTVLGKRHGQQQQLQQQQQRRRSASVSLNSSSSGALGSPPSLASSTPSLRRKRAVSSVVSIEQHGSDDDSWLKDHGDNDPDVNVLDNSNDGFPSHTDRDGDRRPRRDSVLSASAPVAIPARPTTGKGKAKANGAGERRMRSSSKARKTDRNVSPRGEEARGRRSSSTDGASDPVTPIPITAAAAEGDPSTTPSIVISTPAEESIMSPPPSTDDVATTTTPTTSMTSPPNRRGSTSGGRTPRKRKNSNASTIKAPSPPAATATAPVGLPPKQPKQASPTVRPRRTRKVRMYDPYSDKSGQTASLSKPLQSCLEILQELMAHEFGWVFNTPVDPLALNIPDYFDVIKNPMDLGTIKTQLQSGHYETPEEFAADVRLVWNNALTYNEEDNEVHVLAKEFQAAFEQAYASIQAEWDRHKQLHPISPTKNSSTSAASTTTAAATTTSTQAVEGGDKTNNSEEADAKEEPAEAAPTATEPMKTEETTDEIEAEEKEKREDDSSSKDGNDEVKKKEDAMEQDKPTDAI